MHHRFYSAIILAILLAGCARTDIHAPENTRTLPSFKTSNYATVMISEIEVSSEYKNDPENIRASNRIQEVFNQELSKQKTRMTIISDITSIGATQGLVIFPTIEKIKYVNGQKRFKSGPGAGSSAVLMKISFYEYPSKKLVHETYIHHNSMEHGGILALAGATGGAADNRMLSTTGRDLATFLLESQ